MPGRERRVQGLQRDIVSAEEAAFTDDLRRTAASELTAVEQLREVIELDDRIVGLRRSVERTARIRFQEGVITASEYLDRNTEALSAEIAQSRHRVELAQAAARLLTTLGLEVQ
jgi:outer membrane protein TolC